MSVSAAQRGFTLLEMVVVLVLTGFLIAIVVPNVQRIYDSMVNAGERKELIAAVNGLPVYIQELGLPYTLTALPDERLLHSDYGQLFLEKDAELHAVEPIFISAAGFCPFGGDVELHVRGRIYSAKLEPPRCLWP